MPSRLWEAITKAGNSVAEQVAHLYGTARGGRPDTRAAAEGLGVTQRTVERWIARDHTPTRGAGQQLTEQHQAWRDTPTGQQGATIGQQVANLYGTTSRGRPDTRAAAAALGVSQRTVQRWVAQDRAPDRGAGQQLTSQHQTWRDTAAGRQGQIDAQRDAQLRQRGTVIRFTGRIRISSDDKHRTTSLVITGEEMAAILDAAQNGDDAGAHQALEDAFSNAFGGSVSLTPTDLQISD